MIKTIFFDFGGVIGTNHNQWDSANKRIKEATGLTFETLEVIFQKHWKEISVNQKNYMTFLEDISAHAKKPVTAQRLLEIYKEDTTINEEIVDIMQHLREKGFRVVLLANESKDGEVYRLGKIAHIVETIYSSASLGLRKPDPEIFKLVLRKENITPDQAMFIDDKTRNTEVAQSLGIKSIVYKNPKQLLFDLSAYLGL